MKKVVIGFLFKQVIKYLNTHRNLIPGPVDDTLVAVNARALGV